MRLILACACGERRKQRARLPRHRHVVGVLSRAGEKALVLAAAHRLADRPGLVGTHGGPLLRHRGRARLHRLDDVVIAGAAADVAVELLADRLSSSAPGWRATRSSALITMPGVQKPHCRPWHSRNAACIGCSVPSAAASPSIVRTLAPAACAASTLHDLTARPSTSTVHAPHWAVSQPTCVPVSARSMRRKSTSSVRSSTVVVTALPFTVERKRNGHERDLLGSNADALSSTRGMHGRALAVQAYCATANGGKSARRCGQVSRRNRRAAAAAARMPSRPGRASKRRCDARCPRRSCVRATGSK